MRAFGLLMIAVGVAYLLYAFNMDVSVSTPSTYVPGYGSVGGGSVANLDLMSRRQNHLIVAALITIIGVILSLFGSRTVQAESVAAIPNENRSQPFTGDRDLASDAYRMWLAKSYGVSRNEVFERFVMGESTFASLDEALAAAHVQEQTKIEEGEAMAEKIRLQREERQEIARIEAERADAEWKKFKPKLAVGSVLASIFIFSIIFLSRETPEQRSARLAKEQALHAELIKTTEVSFGIILPNDASKIVVSKDIGDWAFLCGGSKNGSLLKFTTGWTKEQIKSALTKTLGPGRSEYEVLPDNFDWNWDKKERHYELTMFSEAPPIEANLCMTVASK